MMKSGVLLVCFLIIIALQNGCGKANSFNNTESQDNEYAVEDNGYDQIGGSWGVGAIYYENHLIDIHDNESIESMYKYDMLSVDKDETFTKSMKMMFINKGTWSKSNQDEDNVYLLNTETSYKNSWDGEKLKEEEIDSEKTQYIATLLDENTLSLAECDPVTGKKKANTHPILYVKEGKTSAYIQDNKTHLK